MTDMKHALVTGANKGIGLATTRALGKRGYRVWLGCRDEERGTRAAAELRDEGIEADCLLLDVADAMSVARAAERLDGEIGALHALVNNAGINFGPPESTAEEPVDDIRAMFDVDVFGAVRVTQGFLPLLRRSGEGRIVMVSSGLGSIGATLDLRSENWNVGYAGYSASKTALNMMTVKFAKELAGEGIKVNAADPGLTATDFNGHMGDRTPEDACGVIVRLATLGGFGPTGGFFLDEGAETRPPAQPW